MSFLINSSRFGNGGGGGSIALVQQQVANTNGNTTSPQFSAVPGAGSTIIACISSVNTRTVNSVSGCGATWAEVTTSNTQKRTAIWIGFGANGVNDIVTVTLSGAAGSALRVNISEWTGIANAVAEDFEVHSAAAATTPITGTVTNTSPNALIIANFGTSGASPASAILNGFTAMDFVDTVNAQFPFYRIVAAAGNYDTGFNMGAANYDSVIAALGAA